MKTHSLLAASLLPFALAAIACGGSAPTDLQSTPPSPSGSAANDAGPAPTTTTTPATDAGAPDANVAPPLAKHCGGTVATANLCLENAQGRAGDVVDVEVHLVGSTTCTEAFEANGHVVVDAAHFQLANPADQVDCITRELFSAPAPGTTEIMWSAFGGGSITSCPKNLTPGKVDVIKVKILPGTPPGVYPIRWSDAGIAAPASACAGFGSGVGIDGTVRVLP
jgi:hypothetical protein